MKKKEFELAKCGKVASNRFPSKSTTLITNQQINISIAFMVRKKHGQQR
jgi:hypothetical protein